VTLCYGAVTMLAEVMEGRVANAVGQMLHGKKSGQVGREVKTEIRDD